ncbi:phosphotransferase family protein [Frankia sp. AgPm24]|uniref:phosphotransferase family protein n=1 Tax=Frankia sp. AgPm24 TaxID=631128 RepID=UPI00200EDD44|nr:phosphotransferase family protein [Frankia sp. AgPm24]MCK9923068.1 phosphotransferase family protein [Frankia sp. AgPm24]
MAVPVQTDPEWLRARLTAWLGDHPPRLGASRPSGAGGDPDAGGGSAGPNPSTAVETAAARWELGTPRTTGDQGLSGELVRVEAHRIAVDGARAAWPLVVRFAPRRYRLYPWDRFADECRLVEILARHSDVPVPPVYGYELDPAVLGAPFLVMGLVDGQVPPDIPPYHMGGFPSELPPDAQARVWDAGLVAMALVHRLDPGVLGVRFAARLPDEPQSSQPSQPSRLPQQREHEPEPATPGQQTAPPESMLGQLASYERHLDFFAPADDTAETVQAAGAWLRAHPPAERHPPRLLWGDARLGNLIFQGERVAALLDWEMMSIGQPESDLAWYLYMDRYLGEGVGATPLPGLPGRGATVRRYAELLGRPLDDLGPYLLFASVRHTLLAARVTRLIREHGLLPADQVPPMDRYSADLLTRVLAETRDPDEPRPPHLARHPYRAPEQQGHDGAEPVARNQVAGDGADGVSPAESKADRSG